MIPLTFYVDFMKAVYNIDHTKQDKKDTCRDKSSPAGSGKGAPAEEHEGRANGAG